MAEVASPIPVPVLVSATTAARMCQVSRATIYAWMRRGELPSVKIGGSRRIRLEDIYALGRDGGTR